MLTILQRVAQARVIVAGQTVGQIGPGLLALTAVHRDDTAAEVEWMAGKLVSLRVFRSDEKHFDIDVREAGGSILLVSNFTVAASTRKGRRPSFDAAAAPEPGQRLFDALVQAVRNHNVPTATGQFGADMQVDLTNDGPATFILDSRGSQ